MHEHDPDLIAALADGSLADETEARALIDSCPECLSEYQDQVEVLALLASASGVKMNDLEKAALHRDLWAELRVSPSKTGSPWWFRWSYAAAGLFVLVGLAAVLSGQILIGGADSGGDALTFSEIGSGLGDSSGGGETAPLSGLDAEGDAQGATESATTTAAAADAAALPYPFAELADEARVKRENADRSYQALAQPEEAGEADDCLERLDLGEQVVVDELELDQRYLVVMPEDGTGDLTVTFIALEDCEIVYVDG